MTDSVPALSPKATPLASLFTKIDLALRVATKVADQKLTSEGYPGIVSDIYDVMKPIALERIRASESVFLETLKAYPEEFHALKARVESGEANAEQLDARLGMCLKAVAQSGRNPYRSLRDAQARFAARVMVSSADEVTLFEVAEALDRLTAHDYDYLEILADRQRRGQVLMQAFDGKGSIRTVETRQGEGEVPSVVMERLLSEKYSGITFERVRAVEHRLSTARLIEDRNDNFANREFQRLMGHGADPVQVSWNVSDLGLKLLSLAQLAPADLPSAEQTCP